MPGLATPSPEHPASAGTIASALAAEPEGPVHLVPFIPGGFGGPDTTSAVLRALSGAGASVIELGIPFSDPVADGPTIQAAYHEALQGGATLSGVFDALQRVRDEVTCPVLTMVSYSVVRRRGDEAFCKLAREAGLDGILCPDLPPPEAETFTTVAEAAGLEPILLVAPNTPAKRRDQIGKLSRGFVYYLSVAGITGQRDALPADLAEGVRDMKGRTDQPVCVGFGISQAAHLRQLAGVADGAVVGSAFVRAMRETLSEGPDAVAEISGRLCSELIGG